MKEKLKKYWMYGAIAIVIIIALLIPREEETPIVDDVTTPSVQVEESDETSYIYVDLKGYVRNPGVYKLDGNSRLFQVINLAGGLLEEADSLAINMSIVLEDEMSIYIPSIHEELPVVVTPDPIEPSENPLININMAGVTLLQTLPGIGPATAQNIIDYRDEFGYFEIIEDIMNVPNIGESTFDEIKDLITVEE